jgi:hypothetical protein
MAEARQFKDLSHLLEKMDPQGFAQLKSRYARAGVLFEHGRTLGPEEVRTARAEIDVGAARDYVATALGGLQRGADALAATLARRIKTARALKMFGSLVAMAASAGLAAATLDLLHVDHFVGALAISAIGFVGAAAAGFSDHLGGAVARGKDAASLYEDVANVRANLARAAFEKQTADQLGQGADAYLRILDALNDAAFKITQIGALFGVGG